MKLASEEFVILTESLLSKGIPVIAVARGGSMLPTFPNGAAVKIASIDPQDIQLGDVILFKMAGVGTVFHRVARIYKRNNKYHFQTWGDNVNHPDPPIIQSEVIGKVISFSVEGTWHNSDTPRQMYLKFFARRYFRYYLLRFAQKLFCSIV